MHALDQKSEGIWDPETYTSEEMESTKTTRPAIPTDWKSKLPGSFATMSPAFHATVRQNNQERPILPTIDASHAIGWSLTGTTNSPSSNLTLLYQSLNGDTSASVLPPGNMVYDPIRQSFPDSGRAMTTPSLPLNSRPLDYPHIKQGLVEHQHNVTQQRPLDIPAFNAVSADSHVSDAEMLLGLQHSTQTYHSHNQTTSIPFNTAHASGHQSHSPMPQNMSFDLSGNNNVSFPYGYNYSGPMSLGGLAANDMMIESQEVDMSTLGGDMMSWLEYLPQDVLNYFDTDGTGQAANR